MTLNQTAKYLQQNDNYLIVMHKNPDGDTVGSAAALCLGLRSLGKKAYLLNDKDCSAVFAPYISELCMELSCEFDSIIAVDAADKSRFIDGAPTEFDLAIDHHVSHKQYAKHTYLDGERAANCEIIFELLGEMGVEFTHEIAQPIYLGIATDTGCFKFGSTTPKTHRIAADLMEIMHDGAAAAINRKFFDQKSLSRIKLEQAVYSTMQQLHGGEIVIMSITTDMMENNDSSDADALSGLARGIEGCKIGILLKQQTCDETKISVRTSPPYSAMDICAVLGGGGHKNAAGCTHKGCINTAKAAILAAVGEVYSSLDAK